MRKATVTSGGRTGGRTRPPAPQEDGPDLIASQIKKCADFDPVGEPAQPMVACVMGGRLQKPRSGYINCY